MRERIAYVGFAKPLVILAVLFTVLVSNAPGSAARMVHRQGAAAGQNVIIWSIWPSSAQKVRLRAVMLPVQMGGTLQVGGTATPLPSPTPTYPSAASVLQNMFTAWQQVRTARFEIITNLHQPTIERFVTDGVGDAACAGPALRGSVTAKDTDERTRLTTSTVVQFVRVKKNAWIKWKGTKGKWARVKPAQLEDLGIFLGVILQCPGASSATGLFAYPRHSARDTSIKDMVNLGPETFQGTPVWHVRLTVVTTDQGTSTQQTWDALVSQDRFLPYHLDIRGNLAKQMIDFVVSLSLSKFGEKLQIKKPKGS